MALSDPYGIDVALGDDGDLVVTAQGAVSDVDGADNVAQALRGRFRTRRGELYLHPDYGTTIDVGGRVDVDLLRATALQEAGDVLRNDPRFLEVVDVTASTVSRRSLASPRLAVGPGLVALPFTPADRVDVADGTIILVADDTGLVTEVWIAPGNDVLSGTGAAPALTAGQVYWRTDAAAPGPLQPVIEVDIEPGGTLLTGTAAPGALAWTDLYFQLDGGGVVIAVWASPLLREPIVNALTDHYAPAVALNVQMRLSGGEALTVSGLPDVRLSDVAVDVAGTVDPSELYGDLVDLTTIDGDLIDPTRDDLGESVTLEQLTGEA